MLRRTCIALCFLYFSSLPLSLLAQDSFDGTWETTFGTMYLQQKKDRVTGFYSSAGVLNKIEGKVEKKRWKFTYQEPLVQGEGHFDLLEDSQLIAGEWRPLGTEPWHPWLGKRVAAPAKPGNFAGVWATSFGRMRLQLERDAVEGCYAFPYGSTITGEVVDGRFTFEYREPQAAGAGWFELSKDGRSFQGQWRPAGTEPWLDWYGMRVDPVPGRTWLVIVEAHWELDLAEPEYSFGAMLRSFFARAPRVQVRHRFANSGYDLAAACHEITYLTEPVTLVVASHGTGEGVNVRGQTVGAEAFTRALRHAPNIQLLHFSSCSIMHDSLPSDIMKAREKGKKFPISGYTLPVDWAGSAVLEFLYFDFILSRGVPPARAAEQVKLLVPFAGDRQIPQAMIPPAGFRILTPGER